MDLSHLQPVIAALHATPQRLVFEFSGAGSLALWWLHSVAGSSRTVLEATDRYATRSLADLIGHTPTTFVAATTASAMARQAYQRALALRDDQAPVLGVACTASIATDHPKRGDHRGVVATCDDQRLMLYSLTLAKGRRERLAEETLVSRLVIHAICAACSLDLVLPLDLSADDRLITSWSRPGTLEIVAQLLAGTITTVTVYADGHCVADQPVKGALLSGSFNPLHSGHIKLAETAARRLGLPALFELPVINADKGSLTLEEILRRLTQFYGQHTLVLSRAPLFRDKADLFPGSVFVIGYDTAIRLVAPHYYGDTAAMHAALDAIRAAGCRFLVAGRSVEGHFHTLDDVPVPPAYQDLFLALPADEFRVDLSSTELRRRAGKS